MCRGVRAAIFGHMTRNVCGSRYDITNDVSHLSMRLVACHSVPLVIETSYVLEFAVCAISFASVETFELRCLEMSPSECYKMLYETDELSLIVRTYLTKLESHFTFKKKSLSPHTKKCQVVT